MDSLAVYRGTNEICDQSERKLKNFYFRRSRTVLLLFFLEPSRKTTSGRFLSISVHAGTSLQKRMVAWKKRRRKKYFYL